jgi:hypothetical protein
MSLELKSTGNKDAVAAMHNFWRYQYEQAKVSCGAAAGRIESARRANKEAREAFARDEDMSFFGPSIPYTEARIKEMQEDYARQQKNFDEVNTLYNFFMDYLFDHYDFPK